MARWRFEIVTQQNRAGWILLEPPLLGWKLGAILLLRQEDGEAVIAVQLSAGFGQFDGQACQTALGWLAEGLKNSWM